MADYSFLYSRQALETFVPRCLEGAHSFPAPEAIRVLRPPRKALEAVDETWVQRLDEPTVVGIIVVTD